MVPSLQPSRLHGNIGKSSSYNTEKDQKEGSSPNRCVSWRGREVDLNPTKAKKHIPLNYSYSMVHAEQRSVRRWCQREICSESIEWFTEDHAFLRSYNLAPVSKLSLFLSLSVYRRSIFLTGEGGREWVGEEPKHSPRESIVPYKSFKNLWICLSLQSGLHYTYNYWWNRHAVRRVPIERNQRSNPLWLNWDRIQRESWRMGPYGVDCNLTLCPLQSRLQHIYHGQPYRRH